MLFWLAIGILAVWVLFSIESGIGSLRMRHLARLPADGTDWPPVSVVVAGRDEERSVRHAVSSLLALDYPDFEVVFVNDRSGDGTGKILDDLAANDPRLRVVHLRELPQGWLGKNHALHVGAATARGTLLLFTDADIVWDPSALRRAVRYMREQNLDHLTASPLIEARGAVLSMFVAAFGLFFSMFARPWRATNRSPRNHVGVGAFNLVRAELYRAAGGHEPIRMRPDDDMKLAKLLKKAGGREELVFGRGMIGVEWYHGFREAALGLEKNAFSGVDYSVARLAGATVAIAILMLWPFLAVFVTTGATRLLSAVTVVVLLILAGTVSVRSGAARFRWALLLPVGVLLFVYVLWRAALINLRDGGIRWRGTFYSLSELRANRV